MDSWKKEGVENVDEHYLIRVGNDFMPLGEMKYEAFFLKPNQVFYLTIWSGLVRL